jgi:uncharacterized membrane protein YjgN (DUF898 family)
LAALDLRVLLLLVTLGIYRFWLTTDTRRFLWSNTEMLGDPLEYTGTARELLIGFLIAVAILIPFYAFIFLLALTQGFIGQLAGVIGFALATVLGHYAVYRARRYRLSRTVFRGCDPSDRIGLVLCHHGSARWT